MYFAKILKIKRIKKVSLYLKILNFYAKISLSCTSKLTAQNVIFPGINTKLYVSFLTFTAHHQRKVENHINVQ